ncbi:MAG: CopG family transcriptional regulator [Acidobacteria bacterium]|nr:CopG family transcriptional regulator [Acidobacteriota bacterium]
MSATRTQIYLNSEQRARIDDLAASRGVTMAEIVRLALDDYLDEESPDPATALAETFGISPDNSPPSRDEWVRG